MSTTRWPAGLLLISAALLSFELLLMRLLSLAYWGHFAGFVISIAMLGISSSGLLLFFQRESVRMRPNEWFAMSSGGFGLTAPLGFILSQRLPFTPFLLTWSLQEYALLAARSLLFFVPFFLAGIAIGVPFVAKVLPMGRLYFWNMLGSGLPALPLLFATNFVHPMGCLVGVTVLAMAVPVAAVYDRRTPGDGKTIGDSRSGLRPTLTWIAAGAVVTISVLTTPFRYSEYKDLPKTLLLPEARLLEKHYGWDGVVQLVESPHTRYLPGLSLNFAGALPPARLVFTDAGAMTLAFGPEVLAQPTFLRMTPEALSYRLTSAPAVLSFYGGTAELWRARSLGARQVQVFDDSATRVELLGQGLQRADARQLLETKREVADVITVSLLGTHGTATAGAASLDTSFLLTREGCARLFDQLSPAGHAVFSTWVENPPRSGVRLFALWVETLRRNGISDASRHLLALRSYSTLSLFISHAPFPPEAITSLKQFCEENSFDLVWYDGIDPAETNQFNVLPDEPYYAAFAALVGENASQLLAASPFVLQAPTDDRPFFNQYFRWAAVPEWIRTMGMEWLPFVEWGYILHVAALVVVTLLGLLLLIVPCFFTRTRPQGRNVALFFSLGVAYMFVQIWAIYKLNQFIAHPLLAAALVLSVMLIASGCGAAVLTQWRGPRFPLLLAALFVAIALFPILLRVLYPHAMPVRVFAAAIWLVLPSFFMGFPFPNALAGLTRTAEVPWALALNGFGSVIGSLLATIVAIHLGLLILGLTAVALYAGVAFLSPRGSRIVPGV